jgi:hypothetical protein
LDIAADTFAMRVPAQHAMCALLRSADAHQMRRASIVMQALRTSPTQRPQFAGTHDALARAMRSDETWTIPLHVIMWTTISVGLIMALAVIMLH